MTVTLTLTADDGAVSTIALPAPTVTTPTLAQLLSDKVSVWLYDFQKQGLSLNNGGYYISPTAGYAVGKGVWAASGASYMCFASGYGGFGWDYYVNPGDRTWWQSLDATFPPLAMIDITSAGVLLRGSDAYPAVRASLPKTNGQIPYLSSYLTSGYAASIQIPYARRVRFTISGGPYDWPGVWGYGSHEVGGPGGGYEIDDFERFGADNPPGVTAQSTHIAGVNDGGERDTGASLIGPVIETVIVHHSDFIYLFTNGVLTKQVTVPPGASTTDRHHAILDMSVGLSWEGYPTGSIGNPLLTVQSVEILAPTSNMSGIFPPAPPTPVLTWANGYVGGTLRAPPAGTVVATLSGAATYRLIPYLSTFTGLTVSGSNVVTVGTPAPGSYDFYIEGTDASGMPCLAAKMTAVFTVAGATQYMDYLTSPRTSHCINMDIVGNTLYLCAAWSGLGIYDITNRNNPVEITTITDRSPSRLNAISGVKVVGNYAFAACEQSQSLTVVDIAARAVVAFLQPWVPADPPATGNVAQLSGACSIVLNAAATIAYVSTITRQNLALIDISNPLQPRMISEVRANGPTYWMAGCRDVVINEAAGVAYVACEYTNNIAVIDISNPASPFVITTVANVGNKTQRGLVLNTAMNRLYVAGCGNGFGGMDIWDVSNPRAPVFVSALYGSATYNFYASRGVQVCGNYAYLCSEYGQMFLIADISNELAPVVVAKESSPLLAEQLWMKVQDGYAYIAQFGTESGNSTAGNGLSVIKINPPYPTPAGK